MNQHSQLDSVGCPFCDVARPLVARSDLAVAFEDAYPVSPGHVLVVPRRHVPTYFECTEAEKHELWQLVEQVRVLAVNQYAPDGFNVGFNVGTAAGQTVHHAHVHVIPRYTNDVADPSGGVRHAVIGRGYYKAR